MNEKTFTQIIDYLQLQAQNDKSQQLTNFVERQKDPLIAHFQAVDAKMEGLTRQINQLTNIKSMLDDLAEAYLSFKRRDITKEEYQELRRDCENNWRIQISNRFYNSVVLSSGTASQFLQQLYGLGIINSNQEQYFVNAELLKQSNYIREILRSLLIQLIANGVSDEALNPSIFESSDWNNLLQSLITIQQKCLIALKILHENADMDELIKLEHAALIKPIYESLSDFLFKLFREYVNLQCRFPSGLSLIMMRAQIGARLAGAISERKAFDNEYMKTMDEAEALGYKIDYKIGTFVKNDDTN